MRTLEEINAELRELSDKVENTEEMSVEELDEAEKKLSELEEERKTIVEKAEKRSATLEKIRNGLEGTEVESAEERKEGTKMNKPEYRTAFLKNLLGRELSTEERAAYVAKTTDNGAPVPTVMLDEIWDLVSEEHSILGDITIYRTGTAIEITKHTAVVQGKAKSVAENAANDDEQNTFVQVTLSGKDFSKTVKLTYAMSKMSIDSFEQYLVNEISTSLGEALAEDVIAQIKSDMSNENLVTGEDTNITYKEVTETFAKLKRAKNKFVYVNEATLYGQLCGMVDNTGRPIYQPSAQAGAQGVLLGATVRVEEALEDGEILIGDSKKVVMNVVQDIIVEDDKDIENHKYIYSGYARAEAALMYDKAFAILTPADGE